MIRGSSDDFTEFGVSATGRCCCCASGKSEMFVYPVDLISRPICVECLRGATIAAALETKRRAELRGA